MDLLANTTFWNIVASVAVVIQSLVVVCGIILAVNQLKEMTKTRHLEAMLRVYDMIGSPEARKQRRFIYAELKSKPGKLTSEEQEIMEQVSVTLDRIGKLAESGLMPQDDLLEGHYEVFIRTWKKLEPYIRHHRQIAGNRWVQHFEKFAKIAEDYRLKHYPDANLGIEGAPVAQQE